MQKDRSKKQINRLKVNLAEQGKTNKWIAIELKKKRDDYFALMQTLYSTIL